ncbi:hypothetical protein NKDENANG_01587 [Candidatus Entotheonellaceae bacterium PAL068K]
MQAKALYSSFTLKHSDFSSSAAAGEINPKPAPSSVGQALYDCFHYSSCLNVADGQGWGGLSCEACKSYRPIPDEAIPDDACAQLLGAVLRTAQHDLQQGFDDNFWEAAAFVFHQQDFAILCGLLNIDASAARQAHWSRLGSAQKQAIAERWPQMAQSLYK